MLTAFQRSLIFPRHYVTVDPVGGQNLDRLERWGRDIPEGRVEAWYLVGDGRTPDAPGPAVIFAHGNGEAIDNWGHALNHYRKRGISVLLPEYRGYGRSAGRPGQAAITEDFVFFYDTLQKRPEVDARKIIFHGRSLGGGVVGALAVHRPPALFVLESTFTSLKWFARRFFVPDFLVADPFDTLSTLKTLDVPVLIFHGRYDSVVPFSHAERLKQGARRAHLVPYACDHNDLPPDPKDYWHKIDRFFDQHL